MLEISSKKNFVFNLFSIFFCQNWKENFEHTFQTILRQFFFYRNKRCYKFFSFFCWNAVEREPVPIGILNPKACGVQGCSPGGGCRGTQPPAHKKKTWIFFFDNIFIQKIFQLFSKKKKFSKSSETYAQNFGPVTIKDMQTHPLWPFPSKVIKL